MRRFCELSLSARVLETDSHRKQVRDDCEIGHAKRKCVHSS